VLPIDLIATAIVPQRSLLALTNNTVSRIVNLSCIEPNELNMLDKQNPPSGGAKRKQGRKAEMGYLSRRSDSPPQEYGCRGH
jgi:hypothetical protein